MTPFEKIQAYSKAVCGQIRWKKAHAVVSEEIENHLVDQRNAYMADGADEAAATDKALTQMGDPVAVGTELDRTHRPRPQWGMLTLTAMLLVIGLLIRVFLISSNEQWLAPSVISMIIGLGLMAAAYFMDFTLIGKHPKAFYFAILAISIITVLITPVINGRLFVTNYLTLLFSAWFCCNRLCSKKQRLQGDYFLRIGLFISGCSCVSYSLNLRLVAFYCIGAGDFMLGNL